MPVEILDLIKSMKIVLFSFSFLPTENFSLNTLVKDEFGYIQENTYLYGLDLKSASALTNITNLLIVTSVIVSIHAIIAFCYLYCNYGWKFEKWGKFFRFFLSWMTFNFYVYFGLAWVLLLLLVTFQDLNQDAKGSSAAKRSHLITYFLVSLIGIFAIFNLFQWWRSRAVK